MGAMAKKARRILKRNLIFDALSEAERSLSADEYDSLTLDEFMAFARLAVLKGVSDFLEREDENANNTISNQRR